MRNIFAILLIVASIGIYYGYTKSAFGEIRTLKTELSDYNDTIAKANTINKEKDVLIQTVNSFKPEDKARLTKLIPDNADNVRLILDIQNIADGTGLVIQNIEVNDENKQGTQAVPPAETAPASTAFSSSNEGTQKYNSVNLSFSVVSNYANLVLFLGKLEQSLRLVDITTLTIKSGDVSNIYNFDITLKAYWLR